MSASLEQDTCLLGFHPHPTPKTAACLILSQACLGFEEQLTSKTRYPLASPSKVPHSSAHPQE